MKQVTVFTDGSSRGNPGPGGWGAIIASPKNVYELSGHEKNTTNNRMELTAVIESLRFLHEHQQAESTIILHTDSQYVKNGFEKWVYGWQKNGWLTSKKEPVLNQDLWQKIATLKPLFPKLLINHVRGHVGVPANERADELATAAADQGTLELYQGSRAQYPVDLQVTKSSATKTKDNKNRSGQALCYLSFVDDEIRTHRTWADCQAHVTGKSDAKFRRADSIAERDQIISDWEKK